MKKWILVKVRGSDEPTAIDDRLFDNEEDARREAELYMHKTGMKTGSLETVGWKAVHFPRPSEST
jgi:hypothetical protein